MMNGAGSANYDWPDRPHAVGPMGNIVFSRLEYTSPGRTEFYYTSMPDTSGLSGRVSSIICKLDALRAELVAIKAGL